MGDIDQLEESPEEYCIRVATGWGTVFIRYRSDLQYWTKSVWFPDDTAEDGYWYESRVYGDERGRLLENEHNVLPMAYHPNSDDHPPDGQSDQQTAYETLLSVGEGDTVSVRIDDFENTRYPREENPRTISGEVSNVKEDVGRSAGEIQRCVVIGDPRDDGCIIDCGDTGENKMTGWGRSQKYLKAWRPRRGKDRLLLGRVTDADVEADR